LILTIHPKKGTPMVHYKTLFPSKYVAASDLRDQAVSVVTERLTVEEMPGDGEKRPVLYFRGQHKGLVVNVTNAKRLAKMFGTDTDAWLGKEITLYPSETDFRGESVPCVRVKVMEQPPSSAQTQAVETSDSPDNF